MSPNDFRVTHHSYSVLVNYLNYWNYICLLCFVSMKIAITYFRPLPSYCAKDKNEGFCSWGLTVSLLCVFTKFVVWVGGHVHVSVCLWICN